MSNRLVKCDCGNVIGTDTGTEVLVNQFAAINRRTPVRCVNCGRWNVLAPSAPEKSEKMAVDAKAGKP